MKKFTIYIILFLVGFVNLKSQEVKILLNKLYYNHEKELILDYSIINNTNNNYFIFGDFSIDHTPLYMNYSKLQFYQGDSLVILKNSLEEEGKFRNGIINNTVIYSAQNSTINYEVNLNQNLLPNEIDIIDSLRQSHKGRPLSISVELFSVSLMSIDKKTKKQISKKMKKEKFQKFIGTIYSNKIPLKFEK